MTGSVGVLSPGLPNLEVSFLNYNMLGINNDFAGPWRQRHNRLVQWMKFTGERPHVMFLQEVSARKDWFLNNSDPKPYELILLLVRDIEAATGVKYRVAYMVTGPPSRQGVNTEYGGLALLYREPFINASIPGGPLIDATADDASFAPRECFPLKDIPNNLAAFASRIDMPSVWASMSYKDGELAFSRLAFPDTSGSLHHIDVFNFHAQFGPDGATPVLETVRDTVKDFFLERFYHDGDRRLIPPLVVGDFNVDMAGMQQWEINPGQRLAGYSIVDYSPSDVIGIMQLNMGSRYLSKVVRSDSLPGPGVEPWSDHTVQSTVIKWEPRPKPRVIPGF